MVKRLFDVTLALLALVLLAPLMLFTALWIKLDSAGPVLFRQTRVGRHGALFDIRKFRTMRATPQGSIDGRLLTVGEDLRITRAGAFLRRTRIDELPQLIDVLLGHMSMVGPRPEVPRYVAHYPSHLRQRALAVRPGITDPASLHFIDEAALLAAAADPEQMYINIILPDKVARAAAYAEQATLASDVAVLARTLWSLGRSMATWS